ncbi:hypothetical protein KAU15_01220, partial [candidate division WOR-3 bacterium]|nr:hypothetical protein [candidate division WOR-3 bacterium]
INSDISGVVFTNNPLDNSNNIVINAAYGLGEGVVSEKVASDIFTCSRNGDIIDSDISQKEHKITISLNEGIKKVAVNNEVLSKPSLNETNIRILIDAVLKIENHFSCPQDIEFAFADNILYILQSRPITTIKQDLLTWDNSNIVESFSGPTTPLTFSFANKAYTTIYKMVLKNFGVNPAHISKNAMIFSNMIGFLNKRVYYSLESWFKTLSFLPGYDQNKKFMEEMMGVNKSYKMKSKLSLKGIFAIMRIGMKIFISFLMHEYNIQRFMKQYNKSMQNFKKSFDSSSIVVDYVDMYRNLENEMLSKWTIPINNDIFTMIFYGLLQKYIIFLNPDSSCRLQNDLLAGEGDIESTKVAYMLWDIADMIKNNIKATKAIEKSEKEFLDNLSNDPDLSDIKNKFNEFLNKYGNRSVNELKLEIENIVDDPTKIIPLIKQYVENSRININMIIKKEQKIRDRAFEKTMKIINKKSPLKKFIHSIAFRFILSNARKFVKNRENLRFCRTNVFGNSKKIFRSIAAIFVKRDIISNINDIFYLTVDEIFAYIYGISVTQNLKPLIKLRKREESEFADKELPERFVTGFMPYIDLPNTSLEEYDNEISGLGCSPGTITGKIQKVYNPYSTKVNAEIMIAEKTDPGWLPIFPLFKAIIIERGSMLSHSAIVAREMGIPAIVGVRGAMKLFDDGDIVKMNGNNGKITIIKKKTKK